MLSLASNEVTEFEGFVGAESGARAGSCPGFRSGNDEGASSEADSSVWEVSFLAVGASIPRSNAGLLGFLADK